MFLYSVNNLILRTSIRHAISFLELGEIYRLSSAFNFRLFSDKSQLKFFLYCYLIVIYNSIFMYAIKYFLIAYIFAIINIIKN